MDLRSIDFQLLACFDALMTELSVTQAAIRMNMSQPAMSNALARMRHLLADPLLVRTSQGMQPTPFAVRLHREARPHLRALMDALVSAEPFSPSESAMRYRIAASDFMESLLLSHLVPLLRLEAPRTELVLLPPDRNQTREWLERGDIDIAIGYYTDLPESLRVARLYTDTTCCIAARGHPGVRGNIDLQRYLDASHAYCGGLSQHQYTTEVMVDRTLQRLSLQREIALRTTSLHGLASAVASSDLLGTISRVAAQSFAGDLRLQLLELPFDLPAHSISMVWHERTQRQAGAQWLRAAIRRCGAWPQRP